MSNGEFCCAVGICCPPSSVRRRTALIHELMHGTDVDEEYCESIADWLIANVDMAPKGTFDLSSVADTIKKNQNQGN